MDLMAIARRGVRVAIAEHNPQTLLDAAARLLEAESNKPTTRHEPSMQYKMEEMAEQGELDIFNHQRWGGKSVSATLTVRSGLNELKLRSRVEYQQGYPLEELIADLWIQYKKHNP